MRKRLESEWRAFLQAAAKFDSRAAVALSDSRTGPLARSVNFLLSVRFSSLTSSLQNFDPTSGKAGYVGFDGGLIAQAVQSDGSISFAASFSLLKETLRSSLLGSWSPTWDHHCRYSTTKLLLLCRLRNSALMCSVPVRKVVGSDGQPVTRTWLFSCSVRLEDPFLPLRPSVNSALVSACLPANDRLCQIYLSEGFSPMAPSDSAKMSDMTVAPTVLFNVSSHNASVHSPSTFLDDKQCTSSAKRYEFIGRRCDARLSVLSVQPCPRPKK